jgi:hypothetical protein
VRFPALLSALAAVALWSGSGRAECTGGAPCLDAEPLWLTPSARHFTFASDTAAPPLGKLAGSATIGFRYEPVVLEAPAPSAAGREINLIRHTTDLTAGLLVGIGSRMELTLALPAGLYQRGAGIKGVTHQFAPPISEQSLHDPRLGFGYALPFSPAGITGKLRLELKLPLGDQEALMGEQSFVMSPTLAIFTRSRGWFSGLESGVRLRRPSEFFGRRVGTQFLLAGGVGYELSRPELAFMAEVYALQSLAARTAAEQDTAAEWLASVRFRPKSWPQLAFGLGGGTGIPARSSDGEWRAGVGAPLFRALVFARWLPQAN